MDLIVVFIMGIVIGGFLGFVAFALIEGGSRNSGRRFDEFNERINDGYDR
jgi:NhaP-type Na+/H+ or K+/H+ antiporter